MEDTTSDPLFISFLHLSYHVRPQSPLFFWSLVTTRKADSGGEKKYKCSRIIFGRRDADQNRIIGKYLV